MQRFCKLRHLQPTDLEEIVVVLGPCLLRLRRRHVAGLRESSGFIDDGELLDNIIVESFGRCQSRKHDEEDESNRGRHFTD